MEMQLLHTIFPPTMLSNLKIGCKKKIVQDKGADSPRLNVREGRMSWPFVLCALRSRTHPRPETK